MFETLNRLWREGKLTESALDKAITLNWITEEKKKIIIEQKQCNRIILGIDLIEKRLDLILVSFTQCAQHGRNLKGESP